MLIGQKAFVSYIISFLDRCISIRQVNKRIQRRLIKCKTRVFFSMDPYEDDV